MDFVWYFFIFVWITITIRGITNSTIKNEKNSSLSAGFGTASRCEVYIFEHDVEKAKPLLEEFAKTEEG